VAPAKLPAESVVVTPPDLVTEILDHWRVRSTLLPRRPRPPLEQAELGADPDRKLSFRTQGFLLPVEATPSRAAARS
jgi:hypothetical protein